MIMHIPSYNNLRLYIYKCQTPPVLGCWTLKHNCPTEELVVFNANMDNCGDQEEYKTKIDSNGK